MAENIFIKSPDNLYDYSTGIKISTEMLRIFIMNLLYGHQPRTEKNIYLTY